MDSDSEFRNALQPALRLPSKTLFQITTVSNGENNKNAETLSNVNLAHPNADLQSAPMLPKRRAIDHSFYSP